MRISAQCDDGYIRIAITHRGRRRRINTGDRAAGRWDNKKQRLLDYRVEDHGINDLIDSIIMYGNSVIRGRKADGDPITVDELAALIEVRLRGEPDSITLTGYLQRWLDSSSYTGGTLRRMTSQVRNLIADLEGMTWQGITIIWHRQYIARLRKDSGPSTPRNRLRVLRRVMRQAYDEGLHDNRICMRKDFVPAEPKTEHLVLSYEQILQLDRYEHYPAKYRNAVDIFIAGFYSGMRYGDFVRLKEYPRLKIDGIEIIQYDMEKKQQRSRYIPVTAELDEAISRDWHPISSQKLRDYLKEAAEMAGLTDRVMIGGKYYRVCDKIVTHTARRSYITHMEMSGIDSAIVRTITDHTSESSYKRYDYSSRVKSAISAYHATAVVFAR